MSTDIKNEQTDKPQIEQLANSLLTSYEMLQLAINLPDRLEQKAEELERLSAPTDQRYAHHSAIDCMRRASRVIKWLVNRLEKGWSPWEKY